MAAARGGRRRGHDREREGDGKGGGEVRKLTRSMKKCTARSGEAGRRQIGLGRGGRRRGRTAAAVVVEGVLARFSRRGGAELQGGDDGAVGRSSGGRTRWRA